MKLPASVGQKKTKAIEQVLEELGIGRPKLNRMFKENIVFNSMLCQTIIYHVL